MAESFITIPDVPPPSYHAETGQISTNPEMLSGTLNWRTAFPEPQVAPTVRHTQSEPVVLSWNGTNNASTAGSSSNLNEHLPGYNNQTARIPTGPVTYAFSPLSFNSMALVPPISALDTRPKYHISVGHNCFMPTSYITTIRRDGTEFGEYVGEFESGISKTAGTVCIRGNEYLLNQVISRQSSTWFWKFSKNPLCWILYKPISSSEEYLICHLGQFSARGVMSKSDTILATFTPRSRLRKQGVQPSLATLEVTPEGHHYFDHIAVSSLIMERKRLAPTDYRSIFNDY